MKLGDIVERFGLEVSWKDKNESVYSNDIILMKIIEEENTSQFLIEYKKCFTKWANSFYVKEFCVNDEKELILLQEHLELIIREETSFLEIKS